MECILVASILIVVLFLYKLLLKDKSFEVVFTNMIDKNFYSRGLKEPIVKNFQLNSSKVVLLDAQREIKLKPAYTNCEGGLAYSDAQIENLLSISPVLNNKNTFEVTWFLFKENIQYTGLAQLKK